MMQTNPKKYSLKLSSKIRLKIFFVNCISEIMNIYVHLIPFCSTTKYRTYSNSDFVPNSLFEMLTFRISVIQIQIIIQFGIAKTNNTYLKARNCLPHNTNSKPSIHIYLLHDTKLDA